MYVVRSWRLAAWELIDIVADLLFHCCTNSLKSETFAKAGIKRTKQRIKNQHQNIKPHFSYQETGRVIKHIQANVIKQLLDQKLLKQLTSVHLTIPRRWEALHHIARVVVR